MAIDPAELKWYKSAVVSEAATNGGAIDTGALITTNVAENIFPDVSDADRITGITHYRKIFFRNENADAYNGILGWIQSQTPATNSAITVLAGGSKSVQGQDSAALSGTFTFAASDTVTATNDVSKEIRPGEKIFNSTDDTNTAAKAVLAVSADGLTITLAVAYAGTTGAAKGAKLSAISSSTFVAPDSSGHGDVLVMGSLTEDQSIGVWIKRVISAAGMGYTNDVFTIGVTNT